MQPNVALSLAQSVAPKKAGSCDVSAPMHVASICMERWLGFTDKDPGKRGKKKADRDKIGRKKKSG
jgi:hypothetical protein